MTPENKNILLQLLHQHKELGLSNQIDYDKFYLYSIITHSTAIEGSTVSEVEAQLLFDEGITAKGKPMMEQLMNLDLKDAYEYGLAWIKRHEAISVDTLITLASKVMARTGAEYNSLGGSFDASKGELHCAHLKHDIEQYKKSVEVVDKTDFIKEMVDKWSIKPSLAEKMADILILVADKAEVRTEYIVQTFGFTETTAKRYLRQLVEYGYLEAHGGNKNRSYSKNVRHVSQIEEDKR